MYCPKCGSKVTDGARFCPQCGARIKDESSEGAATSTDMPWERQAPSEHAGEREATSGTSEPWPWEQQGVSDAAAASTDDASGTGGQATPFPWEQTATTEASRSAAEASAPQEPPQIIYERAPQAQTPVDSGSFGWAVLGFFVPLVGLILWLVWRDVKPMAAKRSGRGALVGFIVALVLGFAVTCSSYLVLSGL